MYHSYGYYFGQIRVAPYDEKKVYILGVPLLGSDNSGMQWQNISASNVHSDHHALWINPDRKGHLINGNDGGINISYDDGAHWTKCNMPAVGQYYDIAVDKADPYHIYGGTQDNGVWYGPSDYEASMRWQSTGSYPYKSLLGGDGMQVQVDWRDNKTIYAGFQFGNYFRIDRITGERKAIGPKHELGERPLRFNWQTPIHLSRHNQDILYLGSHVVHRSMNQGNDWTTISPDLTQGGRPGDVAFGTLTTLHESPLQFGLIYSGSDDGLVHVSSDAGSSWQNISRGFPPDLWVSRIQASAFDIDRVYVALNGYRWDDFRAYIYVSEDQGKTWTSLSHALPYEPVNVLIEDPINQDLLYVGTDHGLYISLDRGQSFMAVSEDLPRVPVHDIVIHPDAHDILLGTHGRSIYRASVAALQKLDRATLNEPLVVFELQEQQTSRSWGRKQLYRDDFNEPQVELPIYCNQETAASILIKKGDLQLCHLDIQLSTGLNFISYDLQIEPSIVPNYLVKIRDEDPDFEFPETDNGKTYLRKGMYDVFVVANGLEKKHKTGNKISHKVPLLTLSIPPVNFAL